MPIVKLRSSDGEVFPINLRVARMSGVLRAQLKGVSLDSIVQPIPVPKVRGEILKKVIQWSAYHLHYSPPVDFIASWDNDFLNVDQTTLFELMHAANDMDIKGLLDLVCKYVANMIKGKSAEEIRKLFNIKNDFTPEEEEKVRREQEAKMRLFME